MDQMTVFICEDNLDSILTGVYDAWASRQGHTHVQLVLNNAFTYSLLCSYVTVKTDAVKAESVVRSIKKKISVLAWQMVCRAAMSDDETKADAVYRFLIGGFHFGARITEMLTESAVQKIFALNRQVSNEAHFYREFLRFESVIPSVDDAATSSFHDTDPAASSFRDTAAAASSSFHDAPADNSSLTEIIKTPHDLYRVAEAKNLLRSDNAASATHCSEILYAKIRPQSNVLAMVTPHFADRLPSEDFLILDVGRSIAAVHPADRPWFLMPLAKEQADALLAQNADQYPDLWKTFYHMIAIKERKNLKLQRNMMPLRYREFMTEQL